MKWSATGQSQGTVPWVYQGMPPCETRNWMYVCGFIGSSTMMPRDSFLVLEIPSSAEDLCR